MRRINYNDLLRKNKEEILKDREEMEKIEARIDEKFQSKEGTKEDEKVY